jgi:hypothetical protein
MELEFLDLSKFITYRLIKVYSLEHWLSAETVAVRCAILL